ncbi:hypothetical protein B484DRAFT_403872 [Ochromonadaceae sp. CCMP2298]|nr:hypothetical protein B484DRAFT_403872 [Ochromonadaceae sp. CCMP2298]
MGFLHSVSKSFGKINSGATKAFGKLESGSKKAFGKLDHVASVVAGGVTQAADKVLVVAKKSGNVLEKVGAAVSVINPVIGAGIMSAGAGAKMLSNQARTTGKAIVGAAKTTPTLNFKREW